MNLRKPPVGFFLPLLCLSCGVGSTGTPPNRVASVTVSPDTYTLGIGNTVQLEAEVRNTDGAIMTVTPTWSSADPSVATCNETGLVTGVGEGSVTITARVDDEAGTASITVVDLSIPAAPSNIAATPLSTTSIQVTWTDNSTNENEFRIDREEGGGGAMSARDAAVAGRRQSSAPGGGPSRVFTQVGTVGANVTVFIDEGLEPGVSYRYDVRACNDNGCTNPSSNPPEVSTYTALAITTATLPLGRVNEAYAEVLSATGGDGTYQWSVTAGSLPPGLNLNTTSGAINGVPNADGTYGFTVQALSGDGQTQAKELTVQILALALEEYCDGPTAGAECTLAVVVVADFPEVLCTDAAFEKNCPLQGETYFGQDGNYTINPESWTYISSGDERMVEAVTGFTWATAAYPADSYADATAACTALSTATYGGATDWRVPSLRELGRIISRTGGGGTWPPNMERIQNSVWWTSTPDKGDASRMVGMSGNWPTTLRVPTAGGAGDFEGARYTYCVNGPEMAGAWLENADGVTVSHTTTGLMWHRSASTNQAMDWNTALQYCESSEAGGFTDWRLPTLREYSSVFDLDTATGFMSDAFGPEPFVNMFTGTPNIVGGGSDAEIAWAREDIGVLDQTNVNVLTGAVRCVRGPG